MTWHDIWGTKLDTRGELTAAAGWQHKMEQDRIGVHWGEWYEIGYNKKYNLDRYPRDSQILLMPCNYQSVHLKRMMPLPLWGGAIYLGIV